MSDTKSSEESQDSLDMNFKAKVAFSAKIMVVDEEIAELDNKIMALDFKCKKLNAANFKSKNIIAETDVEIAKLSQKIATAFEDFTMTAEEIEEVETEISRLVKGNKVLGGEITASLKNIGAAFKEITALDAQKEALRTELNAVINAEKMMLKAKEMASFEKIAVAEAENTASFEKIEISEAEKMASYARLISLKAAIAALKAQRAAAKAKKVAAEKEIAVLNAKNAAENEAEIIAAEAKITAAEKEIMGAEKEIVGKNEQLVLEAKRKNDISFYNHVCECRKLQLSLIRPIFLGVAIWLFVVCVVFVLHGCDVLRFSDNVVIAYLTTTTVNVIGMAYIIMKWIYYKEVAYPSHDNR